LTAYIRSQQHRRFISLVVVVLFLLGGQE